MPVDSVRGDFADACAKWCRLRDCFGGRDSVLNAGNKYVPDLPGAKPNENVAYRTRGNFYNALRRTVQGMAGALFQKHVKIEFPKSLEDFLTDVTLTGMPFQMFVGEVGNETVLVGRHGILIDVPSDAPTPRPYMRGYKAEEIVNWRTTRREGIEILTFLVLKEIVEVTDEDGDPFTMATVVQYRLLYLDGLSHNATVQLFRPKNDDPRIFIPYGPPIVLIRRGTPLTFIPFVFINSISNTADILIPPLLDLADVNLAHFRNSVDHEYGLHLVALPTPYVSGLRPGLEELKIGPSVVWELDLQGQAGMLEFSGAGLASLEKAMDAKVKQMATLGARLFEEPTSGDTATAVLIRHGGEHATVKTLARSLELGVTLALRIVVWWLRIEEKPQDVLDVSVELNKDYSNITVSAQDVAVMLEALQADKISYETWWLYLVEGGWVSPEKDAETEQEAIAKAILARPPEVKLLTAVPPRFGR